MIKKITLSDNIRDIILSSSFTQNGDNLHLILQGQLDRKTYVEVNKFLELIGGKWNRKLKCHIFENTNENDLRKEYSGDIYLEKDSFFPTPIQVIHEMLEFVTINPESILEPSAGEGAIVDYLVSLGENKDKIMCVEWNQKRQKILCEKGYFLSVFFNCLEYQDQHDLIIMNPPFDNEIEHIDYLYENCLLRGGQLISVMSNGVTFRNDKKHKEFREKYLKDGNWKKLPSGSFKESGTLVETIIICLNK